MMQITTSDDSNIIYTTSTGKLDRRDYEKLIPLAEAKIARHGKVRWYFEMQDFHGWNLDTFVKDLKFDFKHAHHFEKVAMVGDRKWEEWMAKLMKAFISADIRYFKVSDKQLADHWIQQ